MNNKLKPGKFGSKLFKNSNFVKENTGKGLSLTFMGKGGEFNETMTDKNLALFFGPCIGSSNLVKFDDSGGNNFRVFDPYNNPYNGDKETNEIINIDFKTKESTEYEKDFTKRVIGISGELENRVSQILIQMPTFQYYLYLYKAYLIGDLNKNSYISYIDYISNRVSQYKGYIGNSVGQLSLPAPEYYERNINEVEDLLSKKYLNGRVGDISSELFKSYSHGHYHLNKSIHPERDQQVIIQDASEITQLRKLDGDRLTSPILGIYTSNKKSVNPAKLIVKDRPQNLYFYK